jgi:hypothetical protein
MGDLREIAVLKKIKTIKIKELSIKPILKMVAKRLLLLVSLIREGKVSLNGEDAYRIRT